MLLRNNYAGRAYELWRNNYEGTEIHFDDFIAESMWRWLDERTDGVHFEEWMETYWTDGEPEWDFDQYGETVDSYDHKAVAKSYRELKAEEQMVEKLMEKSVSYDPLEDDEIVIPESVLESYEEYIATGCMEYGNSDYFEDDFEDELEVDIYTPDRDVDELKQIIYQIIDEEDEYVAGDILMNIMETMSQERREKFYEIISETRSYLYH